MKAFVVIGSKYVKLLLIKPCKRGYTEKHQTTIYIYSTLSLTYQVRVEGGYQMYCTNPERLATVPIIDEAKYTKTDGSKFL